jgi:hypothetical protein
MDYATNAASQAQLAKPVPELGKLKAAAERVAFASNRVESFIARFHGELPTGSSEDGPRNDCYRNDLDSLFGQIERLNNLVNALDHIG